MGTVTARRTPHLVGIAGASGSGKTTLAHALARSLGDAAVVSLDAYYRDLGHLDQAARERSNFDSPEAFDWDRCVADLRALQCGQTVQRPTYDFTTHTSRPETEPVEPRPFLIVEGLLVLHHPDVRALLDTMVFLEVDNQTALDRRIARDRRERGRDPDAVRAQFARDVQPMFERYVQPTARWATLALAGTDPVETSVGRLSAHLATTAVALLTDSEARFRLLVGSANDGIYRITPDGIFTFSNRTASAIMDRPETPLIGLSFVRFVRPDWRRKVMRFYRWQIKNHTQTTYLEFPAVTFEGRAIWLGQNTQLEEMDGEVSGLHAIARDITVQRDAADALGEARRREIEAASEIQQTFLHGHAPHGMPDITIGSVALASQDIDGDFFDFLCLRERVLDVVIGDVMGKGIPAALLGAATKSHFVRAAGLLTSREGRLPSVSRLVGKVHAELVGQLRELESFVTLVYARFDLTARTLTLVDCGHSRTLHWHVDTGRCTFLSGENLPLGFVQRATYVERTCDYRSGDVFVLYSDGVTEARSPDGILFGEQRLQAVVERSARQHPGALAEGVQAAVARFSGATTPADDLTCLVLQMDRRTERFALATDVTFHSDLAELDRMRVYVRAACMQVPAVDEDWAEELVLAANETMSNIICHAYYCKAGRTIGLSVTTEPDTLVVRFTHTGERYRPRSTTKPSLPDLTEFPESGFGLYLIDQLVHETRYEVMPDQETSAVTLVKRYHRQSEER